jgi:hypothetical protein
MSPLSNLGYIFKFKIIQPNFYKLYEKYEQISVNNRNKESGPVAIKVQGKLKESTIEDNISIGMRLLEADEIENSSIRRNKSFIFSPKGNIEKLEIIGRDKIEPHGDKNEVEIKNIESEKESWKRQIIIGVMIGIITLLIGAVLKYFLKFNL